MKICSACEFVLFFCYSKFALSQILGNSEEACGQFI